ncbi:hypothetical protein ACF0H5_008704 [Mactra antiquata]
MSRYYPSYRDDSVSDAVFSEDDGYFHDIYSPKNSLYSLNNSVTSLQELYSSRNHSRNYSPQDSVRESIVDYSCGGAYSPTVSNYSTYSQEVKYIFDPTLVMHQNSRSHSAVKMQSTPQIELIDPSGNSAEDDYSHIQFSNRKPHVQRKTSNSSQHSYKSQNGGSHIYGKNPPPPPPRTSSSASTSQLSQPGELNHTQRKGSLSHSMSQSYTSAYYYPQNQTRRKTWSPEGLRQGYGTTSNIRKAHRLRSYSNEQLIESKQIEYHDRDHIYEELESGPPKLAPISGMLNRMTCRQYKDGCYRIVQDYHDNMTMEDDGNYVLLEDPVNDDDNSILQSFISFV